MAAENAALFFANSLCLSGPNIPLNSWLRSRHSHNLSLNLMYACILHLFHPLQNWLAIKRVWACIIKYSVYGRTHIPDRAADDGEQCKSNTHSTSNRNTNIESSAHCRACSYIILLFTWSLWLQTVCLISCTMNIYRNVYGHICVHCL